MGRGLTAVAIVGLLIAGDVGAGAQGSRPPVTFAREIAPLLFAHCGQCHRPEGTAPFSLLTYQAARQRAGLLAAVTARRLMPPWKAAPGSGEFVGQHPLSDAEIQLFQQWVADGALEGDRHSLPPTPTWPNGWQLGQPDLVVSLPKPLVVPADGPDFSRTFILPLPVASVRYVKGFEFHPGNPAAVHHANIRITTLAHLDDVEDRRQSPGMLLFQAAYPDGYFLGWTPGQVAPLLPKGLAWRLAPGTDLVIEVHVVPTGKPEVVQPSVGLFFGTDPPARTPSMLRLSRQNIDIPAGQADYVIHDTFVLPVDVEVLAVQPHAHYRARDVRGTATLPDGTIRPLITIRDWDFRWQHVYRYVTPLRLPKGTMLSMQYTYDNSAANPRNPQQPPVRVQWGQQSSDEMGALWIQMLTHNEHERRLLNAAIHPKEMAEDVIGYETMSRADPSNALLHTRVAVMYDELGRFADAAAHFATVARLHPESAAAHYNWGTALTHAGALRAAVTQYDAALTLIPDYALAHNNLGDVLVRLGQPDQALMHYRRAAQLDSRLAQAPYSMGIVDRARGDLSAAATQFREAIRRQPTWPQALGSLAWLLATAPDSAVRIPEEAVTLAEQAVQLTERQDAELLDVLAAAQAAAGRYADAVRTCKAALSLMPSAPHARAIAQRQVLYTHGRPFLSHGDTPE
jgi:tetratricopeptide (TPR) repeat protein